ncbi:MAG: DUF3014 domain-containing protein [Betaproteobacteria bacterium]
MSRPFVLIAAAIVAALAGFTAWRAWHTEPPITPPVMATPSPPPVAPAPATAAIQHPVEDAPLAATPAGAVPLDHSDATMRQALADVFAGHALPAFLRVDRVIRNIVATIDALPRESVSPTVMPVNPAPGRMAVTAAGDAMAIAPENATRYTPYIDVLKAVDTRTLATVYLKNYPLFQQAYRELGYPQGYFNDRLVTVIDLMLATPDVQGPIALAQPKVVFTYADPALEALPAGQKMLLRIGRDNATVVKAKLREFRAHIVRTPPPK